MAKLKKELEEIDKSLGKIEGFKETFPGISFEKLQRYYWQKRVDSANGIGRKKPK